MKRIILTGGPGAGKTSAPRALRDKGHGVGGDAARSIIRERNAAGLKLSPNPLEFSKQILEREIASYLAATKSLVFFERGVVDVAG